MQMPQSVPVLSWAFRMARREKSCDSSLVRDWQPGLIGFASVEDMPKRSMGHAGL